MSRKILFYFIVIVTFLSSPMYAANYEDGQAAYEAENYKKAVSIWEALAEQGDLTSQLKMAKMYRAGGRVKKDRAATVKYYNQAAEQGSVKAQYYYCASPTSEVKGFRQIMYKDMHESMSPQ